MYVGGGDILPRKDIYAKRAYDKEYDKANCKVYATKIQNSSGIPAAMERMKESGKSVNVYIIEALTEKLRKDGYLE